MPDPTEEIIGCPFAARCRQCMDICKEKKPADYVEGTHRIKCFLFGGQQEKEGE